MIHSKSISPVPNFKNAVSENISDTAIKELISSLDLKEVNNDRNFVEDLIGAINNSPEANHSISNFDQLKTNRLENLFLLKSALDVNPTYYKKNKNYLAKIDEEIKQPIVKEDTYFPKTNHQSNNNTVKINDKNHLINTTKIAGTKYGIYSTSGNEISNCLINAITQNNSEKSNFRKENFSSGQIQEQLRLMIRNHGLLHLINTVKLGYPKIELYDNIPNDDSTATEIFAFTERVAQQISHHIIDNQPYLDFEIAGGILAHKFNKTIVNVNTNPNSDYPYEMTNSEGESRLFTVTEFNQYMAKTNRENIIFIHNTNGGHFEMMKEIKSKN